MAKGNKTRAPGGPVTQRLTNTQLMFARMDNLTEVLTAQAAAINALAQAINDERMSEEDEPESEGLNQKPGTITPSKHKGGK